MLEYQRYLKSKIITQILCQNLLTSQIVNQKGSLLLKKEEYA